MAEWAENNNMPFAVNDCTLITRMAGLRTAMNLREMEERVSVCPIECRFHHFCETVLRPTFDDPDYHNDFAMWAGRNLRDRVLAERLAIINPYKIPTFEDLRYHVLDIIAERLAEVQHIPWAPRGQDFQFMQAVTVIFETGMMLEKPEDLYAKLPDMSSGSIYYHFVEARRRTENIEDDFSAWLRDFGDDVEPLIKSLKSIDFYFLSLRELKKTLIDTVGRTMREMGI